MTTADWVGAIGVTILLVAFALNLFGRLSTTSRSYITLNAVGSGIAGVASFMIAYWPFVILESTWFLVSAIQLARTFAQNPDSGRTSSSD